jgi:hypothetical protein
LTMHKIFRAGLMFSCAALVIRCGYDQSPVSDNQDTQAEDSADEELLTFSDSIEVSPTGSYIVSFRGEWAAPSTGFQSFFGETKHFYTDLSQKYLTDQRVRSLDYLHSFDLSEVFGDQKFAAEFGTSDFMRRSLGSKRNLPTLAVLAKVDFKSEIEARNAILEWYSQGKIWFAEPDYRSKPEQGSFDGYIDRYNNLTGCRSGNPPDYWLNEINLMGAYQELSSQRVAPTEPIIAVMDSGVDFTNPLLAERKYDNQQVGARGCANDSAGCNTTVGSKGLLGDGAIEPFNLQSDGKCPSKDGASCDSNCCHGTHVAGIIAGFKNDGNLEMGGVCPMCKIIAIRVLGKLPGETEGTILDSSIIRGLKYVSYFSAAEGFGIRVVNASFGKFQRSRAVSLLIRLLREKANGVIVIGAAGNEDSMKPNYPAGYSDAIAVSNIHLNGVKHISSNFGRWVDIAAPGDRICSTVPGGPSGDYETKSGTSMAAPVVAGVAGLLLAVNPGLNYKNIKDRLLLTANRSIYENEVNQKYIPPLQGETAPVPLLGTGMVDAEAAIKNIETKNLPLVGALDRVTISCGTVGSSQPQSINFGIALLFSVALLPFWATKGRTKRSNKDRLSRF